MNKKRKRKFKTLYMHTIGDEPATWDGDMVCQVGAHAASLAANLAQIQKEQCASRKWDDAHGFGDASYDYIRVRVPCGEVE